MAWTRMIAKASEWVAGNVLGTIGSAALLGLVGWGATTTIYDDPWKKGLPEPCEQDRICVVVAGLQGDEDGRQTAHIIHSLEEVFATLEGESPIQIQTLPRRISRSLTGNSADNRKEQRVHAQLWMEQQKADVLIYGEVAKADSVLRLSVMATETEKNEGYALTDTLELPQDFSADFGGILAAEIANSTSRFMDTGNYVADVLEPLIEKIKPLINSLPASISANSRASLLSSFANSLMVLGTADSSNERLVEAAKYFEQARAILPEDEPMLLAMIRNNLANIYDEIGSRQIRADLKQEAIKLYEANLEIYTREQYPLDWALTQGNIGSTHLGLAYQQTGRDHFDKAIASMRKALEVYRPNYNPFQWSNTKSLLGQTLIALGERVDNEDDIKEGIRELQDAVSVIRKEDRPLTWASQVGALGDAYMAIGVRRTDPEFYQNAINAYQMALDVYDREADPLRWASSKADLAAAFYALGQRETEDDSLMAAVEAYEEILTEIDARATPLYWGAMEHRLGNAQLELCDRREDRDLCEVSVQTFHNAETYVTREGMPLQWALLQNDIGNAYRVLGRISKSEDHLRKGIEAFELSLLERRQEEVPFDWAASTANLAYLRMKLGVMTEDISQLDIALEESRSTTEIISRESWPFEWAKVQNNIAEILEARSALSETPRADLEEALRLYDQAFEIFREAEAEFFLSWMDENRKRAVDKLAALQN